MTSTPDVDDELAAEMLRQLSQQPRLRDERTLHLLKLPAHLGNTANGELLDTVQAQARAAGLGLRREWKGEYILYQAFHGTKTVAECRLPSKEERHHGPDAHPALTAFAQTVAQAAYALTDAHQAPTVPVYGDYLLTHKQRTQLIALGAIYDDTTHTWYSPESTAKQVRGILRPRACVYQGKFSHLTGSQKMTLQRRFTDRQYTIQGDDLFLLAIAEPEIRATLGDLKTK